MGNDMWRGGIYLRELSRWGVDHKWGWICTGATRNLLYLVLELVDSPFSKYLFDQVIHLGEGWFGPLFASPFKIKKTSSCEFRYGGTIDPVLGMMW